MWVTILNLYAGIEFVFCGDIDYINSDLFYDFQRATHEISITQYSVNDAINIYFANTVTSTNGTSIGGFAHFPWDTNNNLVVINTRATSDGYSLIHEMGHYFGLYHTHHGYDGAVGVTKELVTRDSIGNCKTAGDRLCDTEADPDLSQNNFGLIRNCAYVGTLVDSRGAAFRPDPLNYMSYALGCQNRFTPQQIDRIKLFRYYRTLTCADNCQARRGIPNLKIIPYSYSGYSTQNVCPTCPDYCVLKKTKVGNDVTFNVKITNNGTAISHSCNLGYGLGEWPETGRNYGTIWDLKLGTLVIPSLKPCDTVDIPIKLDLCHLNNDFWAYPLYYFNVWADEYKLVAEEYEGDNTGYCYFRDKCLPLDTIKVSASPPEYGDVWGGGIYPRGEFISVAATPKTGYSFVNWTERNVVVSLDRFYLFTVNGNRNLVANFSNKKYTITTNVSPLNVGTTTGSGNYPENDSVTVTATVNRDSNYVFRIGQKTTPLCPQVPP